MKKAFTTIEVLVTMLVGTIFLFGGYQLYFTIHQVSLINRTKSQASNIAYNHLRKESTIFSQSDCNNAPVTKNITPDQSENLPNLKITLTSSAPYGCTAGLMRFEVNVNYTLNNKNMNERQIIDVKK